MKTTTTSLKISSFVDQTLLPNLKCLYEGLRSGDLLSFEEGLIQLLGGFYNQLCEQVLKDCSEELSSSLKKQAYDEGCRKLVKRPIKFRLLTGHFVELDNYYIKQLPKPIGWKGSRHTLSRHWSIIGNASPGHYDRVAFCCVLSPSYDVAKQLLRASSKSRR